MFNVSHSRRSLLLALILSVIPQASSAQLLGKRSHGHCIDVGGRSARVTAEGQLRLQTFAGRPNYESIAAGDEEERVFVLKLPRSVCIDDGGDFADPKKRFTTVHISSEKPAIMNALRASVGHRVVVSGEGFAAFDGHHHAPLVILADRVIRH